VGVRSASVRNPSAVQSGRGVDRRRRSPERLPDPENGYSEKADCLVKMPHPMAPR
jgi:hypothetical protein